MIRSYPGLETLTYADPVNSSEDLLIQNATVFSSEQQLIVEAVIYDC